MGNGQSTMKLTDEEAASFRQKGKEYVAERVATIEEAQVASRQRRENERAVTAQADLVAAKRVESRAAKVKAEEEDATTEKTANEAAAKPRAKKAATEKVTEDPKAADQAAVEAGAGKAAADHAVEAERKQAIANRAATKEQLEGASAAEQANTAVAEKVASKVGAEKASDIKAKKQAILRESFTTWPLGGDPIPSRQHMQPPPSRSNSITSQSSSDSLLASWEARKEKAPAASKQHIGRRVSSSDDNGTLEASKASLSSSAVPTSAVTSAKRREPFSVFTDERRTAKRPRNPISASQSPVSPLNGLDGERQPPAWYKKMEFENRRTKKDSTADPLLQDLRAKIKKVVENRGLPLRSGHDADGIRKIVDEIRLLLHRIAFVAVDAKVLRNNRILDNRDGLPALFDKRYSGGVEWPYDIKADAEELYNKWCRQVFETDHMRGIVIGKSSDQSSDKLDPKYPRTSSQYHGNGKLLNGQWWPTQLTALRDGAHGSSQGGIYGHEGEGAYSVIMSGGYASAGKKYPDEDHGDWVLYCGTDSDNGEITPGTQRLLESLNSHPVRLLRSSKLDSPYAPEIGFRYDGLYDVVSVEKIDPLVSRRQRHRFKLVRCKDQDPIRSQGPEKRPNADEVREYVKHKTLARGSGPS